MMNDTIAFIDFKDPMAASATYYSDEAAFGEAAALKLMRARLAAERRADAPKPKTKKPAGPRMRLRDHVAAVADRMAGARAAMRGAVAGAMLNGANEGDGAPLVLTIAAATIEHNDANRLIDQLYENPLAARVDIAIVDCRGGDADAAIRLVAALRAHPGEKVTIAHGRCASAALSIFLAGDRRYAFPGATFLIHAATGADPVAARAVDIAHDTFTAKRLGIEREDAEALAKASKSWTAAEAVAAGVATILWDEDTAAQALAQLEEERAIVARIPRTVEAISAEGQRIEIPVPPSIAAAALNMRAGWRPNGELLMGLPQVFIDLAASAAGVAIAGVQWEGGIESFEA